MKTVLERMPKGDLHSIQRRCARAAGHLVIRLSAGIHAHVQPDAHWPEVSGRPRVCQRQPVGQIVSRVGSGL